MAQVRVVWDEAAVKLSCASPSTPVGRAMSRLADDLASEVKRRAPVYNGPPRIGPTPGHPRQVARQPGTLRSSVKKFRQPTGSFLVGPTDMVGGQFLGPMLERGTRPHLIASKGPWPLYSSATRKVYGRPEYAQARDVRGRFATGRGAATGRWVVHHPGTRPRPFIAPAVQALSGRTIRAR